MKPILRNIIAVIVGLILGSTVNMILITIGNSMFPIEGIDINDMNAYASIMPTLEAHYFLFPFLGHAIGTFIGALVAAVIPVSYKMKFALGIGCFFLLGGIYMNYLLPGPTWFTVADIVLAYIPMAWLGGKLALKFSKKS
ncbi:hypothetical protein F0365_10800 [Nonlabens sp. Ci31]|jgi:hypothetical protein|uniref:hypothetical protein n=1 Tax=Nonlabens sp. Ci31 TaxID=2608253 RepID=UPI001463A89D|nr:hypothetical protein [Nonlabens sp. Ci31]QJP34846.1 hypothetical protein F0365_10800 [Nonlabens sp. Ci31]